MSSAGENIRAEIFARWHRAHAKTQGFKPTELMLGKVGKTAEPHGLADQAQILQHHALLCGDQLRNHQLQALHREHAAVRRIVMQMTAFAARETAEAGGAEAGALVDDKGAAVFVKNLEQPVDVHEGQFVDRQKIGRARSVERPAVDIDIKHRRHWRRCPSVLDFNSQALIERGEIFFVRLFDQSRDFLRWKILRPLDQVSTVVVDDN